jgi:hypothetical protein
MYRGNTQRKQASNNRRLLMIVIKEEVFVKVSFSYTFLTMEEIFTP